MSRESKMYLVCGVNVEAIVEKEIKNLPEWVGGHPLAHPKRRKFTYEWDTETFYTYYNFDWCNHVEETSLYKVVKDIACSSVSEPEDFCKMLVISEDNNHELFDNSDTEIEGLDIGVLLPHPLLAKSESKSIKVRDLVNAYTNNESIMHTFLINDASKDEVYTVFNKRRMKEENDAILNSEVVSFSSTQFTTAIFISPCIEAEYLSEERCLMDGYKKISSSKLYGKVCNGRSTFATIQ